MKSNPIKIYKIVREEGPIYDGPKLSIRSSETFAEMAKNVMYNECMEVHEEFWVTLLSNSNEVRGHFKVSQGGTTGTLVDVKLVCKAAIDSLASAVILSHNHPSGTLKPSEADIRITKKLEEALGIFDIKILDHIILTKESYYSFADERIL